MALAMPDIWEEFSGCWPAGSVFLLKMGISLGLFLLLSFAVALIWTIVLFVRYLKQRAPAPVPVAHQHPILASPDSPIRQNRPYLSRVPTNTENRRSSGSDEHSAHDAADGFRMLEGPYYLESPGWGSISPRESRYEKVPYDALRTRYRGSFSVDPSTHGNVSGQA